MLTVKEVAELKGCTERNIKKQILEGKIKATETKNDKNRKMYLIDPVDLDEKLKVKYYAGLGMNVPKDSKLSDVNTPKEVHRTPKRFDEFSRLEREQISLWVDILKRWQTDRLLYDNMEQADEDIIGALRMEFRKKGIEIQISREILYRKLNRYRSGDYQGLLDNRGGWNRGFSSVPDVVWEGFLFYYLDDRKPPFQTVYYNTKDWCMEFYPDLVEDIPSAASFRRRLLKEVPPAVVSFMRDGDKRFTDDFVTYVERVYDDLEANDVWIADNHTFDIMTKYDDGREGMHRLHLTAFMDAKSGVIVGWNITDNPCSNSTLFALRMAILRHGLPRIVYFDNGSEFLTKDIGGRGIRETKKGKLEERPETILSRLGIEMRNAKVRNGKSKPIERFFLTFKNHISKLFDGYTGGHSQERPESLKQKIKRGMIPTDSEIRPLVNDLIELENIAMYGGAEQKRYGGYTKMEVWNESIKNRKQRIVKEEDLNLLLMRTTGYQKVKRKGVFITVAGEKIWYSAHNRIWYQDREVYVRYDPTDLSSVRIYDKEDRYIDTWKVDAELMLRFMDDDTEAVKTASERIAHEKKIVRDFAKNLTENMRPETKIDMLDLMVRKAHAAKEGIYIGTSNVIEPIRIGKEEPQDLLKRREVRTGTDNVVSIDIARMNKNIARRKGLE